MALEMMRLPFPGLRRRLDDEIRDWPRTETNDPYRLAVLRLAAALETRLGFPVLAGYNEFCRPTLAEALDQSAALGVEEVVVLPTMLLRGNEHTEEEIATAVHEAARHNPQTRYRYAWPFPETALVELFANQVLTAAAPPG